MNAASLEDRWRLHCSNCGTDHPLDQRRYRLLCSLCGPAGLLVARAQQLPTLPRQAKTIADWSDWLCFEPVCPDHDAAVGQPPSEPLARRLGLPGLQLLVSGKASAHGATLRSGSFKEFEAIGTLSRVRALEGPIAVIASAGNSALASMEIGNRYQLPAVLVVPDGMALPDSQPAGARHPLLIRLRHGSYADAKAFAAALVDRACGSLLADGGYRNVARRQALALPFLSAVRRLGRLPGLYVQAVGSGCGALAVVEVSRMLMASGLGRALPRLLLVQNHPYAPIVLAHEAGRDALIPWDPQEREQRISAISARVLSTADIPYAQPGGLRDALRQSDGLAVAVTNQEIRSARELLYHCLNLKVCEASGAALAGLRKAAAEGRIDPDALILLHLTGVAQSERRAGLWHQNPSAILEIAPDQLQEALPQVLSYAERMVALQPSRL